MKTLFLILTLPVLCAAQNAGCDRIGCLVNHDYRAEYLVVNADSMLAPQIFAIVESPSPNSNTKQATDSVFGLWQGLHLGAEAQSRFTSPHDATLNAFGQVRFALAKDLILGAKVSLPFGMSGVRYEVNLSKRVF